MNIKTCTKCGIEKNIADFGKDKNRNDKLDLWCKACKRKYRIANKERAKKQDKIRYENNKKEKREYAKQYSRKHQKERVIYNKVWRKKNKEKTREYENNRDKAKKANKDRKYRQSHKKEINARKQLKLKVNINFRIAAKLRQRLSSKMKNGSAVRDLGCSIDFFKQYIELQFQPGMSWENYGDWHLDHIIPLASFDLTDRDQFLKACHYINIQPLWAIDNLKKGTKII